MKKIISLILALVLVLGLAVSANAATSTYSNEKALGEGETAWPVDGTTLKPVTETGEVTVSVQGVIEPVYYVEVEWKTLSFTYSNAGTQWDPETHTYGQVTGGWSANITDAVTVTNRSNADVICTFSITDTNANDGITASLTNTTATTLESAAVVALEDTTKAAVAKTDLTISGEPSRLWINDGQSHTVATVTATISLPESNG